MQIGGIGKVTEQMLHQVLGISTCQEMLQKGAFLCALFSEGSTDFFLSVGLGLGGTETPEHRLRKSMSCERTFSATNDSHLLFEKLDNLAENLADDMQKECLKGRTLTLKLKTAAFEVRTRAATAQNYISSKEDILIYAKKLLKAEMPLSLRLMGLRMSHFSGEKDDSTSPTQKTLDRFFHSSDINSNTNGTNGASCIDVSGGHNDCNDATTKDECSIHDAEKDVSIDQQPSHEENSSVAEGASSVNYDNEAASSSWKVTQTEKFDELGDLTSSKACASSSKPGQHFWVDGYICSLCGFELPPCFEEERQEHSDFHLAEMLQQEEAVDSTARLSKERLAERPCSTSTPTPKKKLKSSKEGKHIPIDSFFLKCNKNS
uniref:DNA-directed DNA polymerase n=1 Tax=Aegilops tauschii subsp. strangulata TaxID=200361 RepID=A0A453HF09_AEGTS